MSVRKVHGRRVTATQIRIAEEVGLDVSSVNKILNRRKGPTFRKETIRRVFKAARRLGYDFTRLKYTHRRDTAREELALPVEFSIYDTKGAPYDRGTAMIKDVSRSGVRLADVVVPKQSFPLAPHIVGIRIQRHGLEKAEILGKVVRLDAKEGGLQLGVRFLDKQEEALRHLGKILN